MRTSEILTYKRVGEEKRTPGTGADILLAIMGVLAGRVELWGMVMPTGIGWAIANAKTSGKKERLLIALATSAAGMLMSGVDIFKIRGLITLAIVYLLSRTGNGIFGKSTLLAAVCSAMVNLVCGVIISAVSGSDGAGYIMLGIEAMLIVGSAVAFENFVEIISRGGSVLTDDEAISLFVSAGVCGAGLAGINIAGVRLEFVLSMYMIIFAAGKWGIGISVTLAAVMGIATAGDDPVSALGIYIFMAISCSMLSSVGRWGIVLGAALANAVYVACSLGMDDSLTRLIEIIIAVAAFFFTPTSAVQNILHYTTRPSKVTAEAGDAISKKMEATTAIEEIGKAFSAVAQTVREMNETVDGYSGGGDEIITKIGQSVCKDCALKSYCEGKNRKQTEQAIDYILQLFKEKGDIVAVQEMLSLQGEKGLFSWNCIHSDRVVEKVRDSLELYMYKELEKKQNRKYREFAVDGMEDMAEIIIRQHKRLSEACHIYEPLAEEISSTLIRNGVHGSSVCVVKNRTGLFEVTAEIEEGSLSLAEDIIKSIMGVNMKIFSEEKTSKGILLCMREKEHYECETAILSLDNKERRTGDTASWFDDGKGFLHCLISDGMGSGVLAAKESGWTVKLYEKLCRAGFEPDEAFRMINNVMITGKTGESCISADGVKINLLNGCAQFTKAGAASSYIKTEKGVEKIGWSSLPLGIIEINELETRMCDISDGGYVVLMSDGLPDNAGDRMEGEHKLRRALAECDINEPRELAEYIMFAALSMGAPKDDMTVAVVKIIKK